MYLPDFLTGFNPLAFCVTVDEAVSSSAILSLVFTVNVDTAEEAAKLLQANVFATDPDYAKKIMQIIRDAKRNPPLF